jgi:hypothetical protein
VATSLKKGRDQSSSGLSPFWTFVGREFLLKFDPGREFERVRYLGIHLTAVGNDGLIGCRNSSEAACTLERHEFAG